jgi:hypothetical protein
MLKFPHSTAKLGRDNRIMLSDPQGGYNHVISDPICNLSLRSTAYRTYGIRHMAYGAHSLNMPYGMQQMGYV